MLDEFLEKLWSLYTRGNYANPMSGSRIDSIPNHKPISGRYVFTNEIAVIQNIFENASLVGTRTGRVSIQYT